MKGEFPTEAAAAAKSNVRARTVWLLECGPVCARCIAVESAYELQVRGAGGWKTISTCMSPGLALQRFISTPSLAEAMATAQDQARKVQDGK